MSSALNPESKAAANASQSVGAAFAGTKGASEPPLPHSRRVGWLMLIVASTAMVATLPGRTHGLGMFTESILKDFQLSRVDFGTINLVASLIGALFCFPAGWLVDRYGVRPVLSMIALLLGLSVCTLAEVSGHWALLALVTLTRGFGQGALTVTSITLAGRSFGRRAAWPMAVYSVLLTIGFIVTFTIVMEQMKEIEKATSTEKIHEWRGVWRAIGLTILVGMVPVAWLLPKGIGRGGDTLDAKASRDAAANAESGFTLDDSYTLREAIATPIFWVFAGAATSFGLAYSGLSLFNENVLNARGFGKKDYESMLVIMTIFGLAGQAACGFGAKRWSYRALTCVTMAFYAAALVSLAFIETKTQLLVASSLLGVAGGMITVIFFAVWGRTFGQLHLGRIQGTAQMMSVFASALGPVVFALGFEQTGSYRTILIAMSVVVALVGVAAIVVPPPQRSRLPS